MFPDPNDAIDATERVTERLARTEPAPARTDMPWDGLVYLNAVRTGRSEVEAVIETALGSQRRRAA